MNISTKKHRFQINIRNIVRKRYVTILIALLLSLHSFAQIVNGISYKAVIKDGIGNVVNNQTIDIKFTIFYTDPNQTDVYQEKHSPTTDANGIIILNMGEGSSIFGDFWAIDWALGIYQLKTEIDLEQDGSYIDFGDTEFKAVPFARLAYKAVTASVADNVTGLERLTEDNTGYRLIGSNPNNFGPIGQGAIDLSTSSFPSDLNGATGGNAIAIGDTNKANGSGSIAIGFANTASLDFNIAIGQNVFATGKGANAIGEQIHARSYKETVLGFNNTGYGPLGITSWEPTDRLFSVGNGEDSGNSSDAIIILKNGTITAPSLDLGEITDDKALTTREYVLTNGSSGLERITDVNTGWRLKNQSPAFHADIGDDAVDLSIVGGVIIEVGAQGNRSFSSGLDTRAIGDYAIAMGNGSTAIGHNSMALGRDNIAELEGSVAIGKYNKSESDGLFMVGNGTGTNVADRNNALIIRENGNAQFDGEIQHTATGSTNLIPIAYGSFDGDDGTDPGDILSGTPNFTVSRAGDFTYTISVSGQSLSASNSSASVVVSTNFFRTANVTYASGNMLVHIFSSTFNKVPAPFQFVIYKN